MTGKSQVPQNEHVTSTHVFVMTHPSNVFLTAYSTIFLHFASCEPDGVLQHERKRVPYRRNCTARVEDIRDLPSSFCFFF